MAKLITDSPIVKVVMLKGQDGEEKLINQADGSGVALWIGTRAEYEAIPEAELIENCIYYITDDTRDDFRTDLNALDTKVDNHYTELDGKIENNATAIADNATAIGNNTTAIAGNTAAINGIAFTTGETGEPTNAICAGFVTSGGTLQRNLFFTLPLPKSLKSGQTFNFNGQVTIEVHCGDGKSFTLSGDVDDDYIAVTGTRPNFLNLRLIQLYDHNDTDDDKLTVGAATVKVAFAYTIS